MRKQAQAAPASARLPASNWNTFSPCGSFFASVGHPTPLQQQQKQRLDSGASILRSRLRVWRCTAATRSSLDPAAGASQDEANIDFQHQFLGQSLCYVKFVETASKRLLVVVGSASGMVAALDCNAGGAPVFNIQLDAAAAAAADYEDGPDAKLAAAATGCTQVCGLVPLRGGFQLLVLLRCSATCALKIIDIKAEGKLIYSVEVSKAFSEIAMLKEEADTGRQLVLLSCNKASNNSSNNMIIFDLQAKMKIGKLKGGTGGFSSIVVDDCATTIAAICTDVSRQYIAIWKVPRELSGSKKIKIPLSDSLSYSEKLSHLNYASTSGQALLLCLTEQQNIVGWSLQQSGSADSTPAMVIETAVEGNNIANSWRAFYIHLADSKRNANDSQVYVARGDLSRPLLHSLTLTRQLLEAKGPLELPLPEYGASGDALTAVTPISSSLKLHHKQRVQTEAAQSNIDPGSHGILATADAALCLKRGVCAESIDEGETNKRRRQQPAVPPRSNEGSSIGAVLRQAVSTGDSKMLENILSGSQLRRRDVGAAAAELSAAQALSLLQLLIQQQQDKPSSSISKGCWLEELVKQHAPSLATSPEGRQQLILLQNILQQRRQFEESLVQIKGRVELLLMYMETREKTQQEQQRILNEALQPLVDHREA